MNIKIRDIYEQKNDVTNKKYDDKIYRFRTGYGRRPIVDIETFLEYCNIVPSKYTNKTNITIPKKQIWLHRVNTKKRLKYYLNKYNGFEIDIKFNINKKYFNVSHDNIDGDENLAEMLKNIEDLKQKYLWLDFKNLEQDNKEIALTILNKIVQDNNLKKNHIIVESNNPKALDIFAKAGYYTSFYLSCYSWDEYDNLSDSLFDNIKKLDETNVDFVSSDANYFDIVKYCFPNVSHLFWVMDEKNRQQIKTNHIFETDENTYVILNQNRNKYYK